MTTFTNNPYIPSAVSDAYVPDQLIAGRFPLVTDTVTIASGVSLKRGAVLGRITASGKFTLALSASSDGSQTPVAILADDVDATSADKAAAVYLAGEFNGASLTLGTGITLAAATAALRDSSIFIKSAVSAADPT